MPGSQYFREDFVIRVDSSNNVVWYDDKAGLPFDLNSSLAPRRLADMVMRGLSTYWPSEPFDGQEQGQGQRQVVRRICLAIDDERIAALPLEMAAAERLRPVTPRIPPIVRLEPTSPRVAQMPMTLPLRLLQLDPRADFSLPAWLSVIFSGLGGPPPQAVRSAIGPSMSYANWSLPPAWRTVDVLHLDGMPPLDEHTRFHLSEPDQVGSLGWLLRCIDVWNTRLVVMRPDFDDIATARRLARGITERGGPAVLVVEAGTNIIPLQLFYDKLIHDAPIDVALALAQVAAAPPLGALFAGSGREELMRVSAPTGRLPDVVEYVRQQPIAPPISARLDSIITGMAAWSFDVRESLGMVPLSDALTSLRMAAPTPPSAAIRPLPPAPRFANLGLWTFDAKAGRGPAIPSPDARLQLRRPVVLGIQIGAPDGFVPVLDAVALLEEPFKWADDKEGVWLSIGVTGLDFTVSGAPLQEVWLPREGASDMVEFVIAPTRMGVSQVRICIYYGADLLMSQRLAARVVDPVDGAASPAASLAEALDVKPERVKDAGWLARMEYAATADLARPPERPNVALSIFANAHHDDRVFTVKTKEGYDVSVTGDAPQLGGRVRAALDSVSRNADGLYAFQAYDGVKFHEATPEVRDAALKKLAEVGWWLCSTIFSAKTRDAMADGVAVDGSIIHVAHSLLEKVIPWALLYDRPYISEGGIDDQGRRAQHKVCPAGLPDASGAFPAARCGTHADCPLSPQGRAAAQADGLGVIEDTIVCARHFWGLRNIIELPPLQEGGATEGAAGSGKAPQRRDKTQAGNPAAMLLGYNAKLALADEHLTELQTLPDGRTVSSAWIASENDVDRFIARLKQGNADLVYLYCHARGGAADPSVDPAAIELADGPAGWIRAARIADSSMKQKNHPLVILNGCNTAKFSPEALSPFIRNLVRDCEVAGVLGTEIPVFEVLAGKVAVDFLGRFLNGESAGEALLAVRRALMAGGNPLGLAYTLYAVSELQITQ